MPLIEKKLEVDLIKFFKSNSKSNSSPEQSAKELAKILTTYIKTATVNVSGTGVGANAGGPIATVVSGVGTIM